MYRQFHLLFITWLFQRNLEWGLEFKKFPGMPPNKMTRFLIFLGRRAYIIGAWFEKSKYIYAFFSLLYRSGDRFSWCDREIEVYVTVSCLGNETLSHLPAHGIIFSLHKAFQLEFEISNIKFH
jgi:hypothetical protein